MNSRTTAALRPTALALALLAAAAFAPAYAGQACELIDADLATEDDGGSIALGANALACGMANTANGIQALSVGSNNTARWASP